MRQYRQERATLALGLALIIAFNQPLSLAALAEPASWQIPVEPIVASLLLALLPGRIWHWLAAALLGAMLWLRLGDQLVGQWLGRPFTALLDIPLGLSLIEIGLATLGGPLTIAITLAVLAVLPLAMLLAWRWQQRVAQTPRHVVFGAAALCVGLLGLGKLEVMPSLTAAHGFDQLRLQVERGQQVLAARQRWRAAASVDPVADIPDAQLLSALRDHDVLLIWIESVGRSALTIEPFRERTTQRLSAFDQALEAAGLHAVSGWLVSPTIGGQSWLAHATLASGVWTADQPSHRQYLQDASADLAHLFRRAGHRTVVGMPAIVSPFPEALRLGFDQLYFAEDLGYRGPPLEWVTMPDQYTLWALQNAERDRPIGERRPLYLQVALISSHAPFTPDIPVVEPWERLGDGSIVHDLPKDGGRPRDVWRDHDTLLAAYGRSVDYTYATLQSYLGHFISDDALVIMIGDHEPARRISGIDHERAVPIHVVAGDPALLEPFRAWGFTTGMRPGKAATEHQMNDFRGFFARAFSGGGDPS